MKTSSKAISFRYCFMIVGICFLTILAQSPVAAGTFTDNTLPQVTIVSPVAGGGTFDTNLPGVNLAGTVEEDNAVKEIIWENLSSGAAGLADASTNWVGPLVKWDWEANGIPLVPGANLITIIATNAAGDSADDFVLVNFNVPPLPPPPSVVKAIDSARSKVKLAIFKDDPGADHCSVVTYLKKTSAEVFTMPMNKDVTVILKLPDPNNPAQLINIYTQTIPANTLPGGSTKYRFTSGGPGIRELVFEKNTSTAIYAYVYIENVDFLPTIREFFRPLPGFPDGPPDNYTAWLLGIHSMNFTVQIGNTAWTGNIPLVVNPNLTNRVEYLFNR